MNKINSDARDIQVLTEVFRNTFDCLAGDCNYKQLPKNISSKTPSGCFNLQSDYITPLATAIITAFNTDEIDSNAKRTCMFYEFMALEPQAFGLPRDAVASRVNSVLGINSANAIKRMSLTNIPNPNLAQITTLNTQITALDTAVNNVVSSFQAAYNDAMSWAASNPGHNASGQCPTATNTTGSDTISSAVFNISAISQNNYNWALCICQIWYNADPSFVTTNATNCITSFHIDTGTGTVAAYQNQLNVANVNKTTQTPILQAQVNNLSDPNQYIKLSLKDGTNPSIPNTSNSSMWDLRTVNSTTQTYPYEASNLPATIGKQLLIARNSSTNNINSTDSTNTAIAPENDKMAGFSASFSRKLDTKFDDGKPYTGNIIAGKNVADLANTSGCTNVSLANFAAVTSNLGASYANGKSLDGGCVVGFVVRT